MHSQESTEAVKKLWGTFLKALGYPLLLLQGCWQEGWGLSGAVPALGCCMKIRVPLAFTKLIKYLQSGEKRRVEWSSTFSLCLNKSKWVVLMGHF